MAGLRYVTPEALDRRCRRWLAQTARYRRDRPLPDLSRSALLIVDAQRYFGDATSHAYLPALEVVLPRIVGLAEAFQAAGRPVFATRHVDDPQHPTTMARWWRGSVASDEQAELLPAIAALTPDRVWDKASYSAFEGTDLAAALQASGCASVVVVGVATHLCCETTARQAFVLGFDVVVVADGCASFDEDLHLGALRGLAHGVAVVAASEELHQSLAGQPGAAEQAPLAEPSSDAPLDAPLDDPVDGLLDLAIVGAGPAGLAAALQARRSDLSVCLFDPGPPGGWARTAEHVENYPGFPGGIDGARLLDRFVAQLELHGAPPRQERRVEAIDQGDEGLWLELDDGTRRRARAVVVATGTEARKLDDDLTPQLGSLAVTRVDALPPKLEGWRVLIVGGGEAAIDQALAARSRGATVQVIARGSFRALPLLLAQAKEQGVALKEQTWIAERLGDAEDRPAQLMLGGQDGVWLTSVDAVVICVGKQPSWPRLPAELAPSVGAVPDTNHAGCTAIPGLYLAGDVRRGRYRQIAIAVGDGIAAAMHAASYLRAEEPWPRREKV